MARKCSSRENQQKNAKPVTQNSSRKKSTQHRSKTVKKRTTKSDVSRQQQLEKKREVEKARRARLKEDPEKYQKYCQKERERNWKRKLDGKIKSVSDLTKKEKNFRRTKQNEWKRNSRLKIRAKSLSLAMNNDGNNVLSKQAKVGRKRMGRNVRRCYRRNATLTEQNTTLKKTVDKLRKRIERMKMRKPESTSPHSRVQRFLKGRRVGADVKKRLVFGEVLAEQLRVAYKDSHSDKFKQVLGRVLCGKIIRKYRHLILVKKHIAPVESSKVYLDQQPLTQIRKPRGTFNFVKDKVKSFFQENSTIDPGKKIARR